MDQDHARRMLAAARVGRLATVTAQGAPHVVPVVFALAADVVYTAVDSKPKTTTRLQRLANVAATGRASLLIDEYHDDWSLLWWVRLDGSALILAADSQEARIGLEALTHKYQQYLSQPPTGPVVAIRPTRWRWWQASPTP
jgi:PPOX class probable F420-dependent enzyme